MCKSCHSWQRKRESLNVIHKQNMTFSKLLLIYSSILHCNLNTPLPDNRFYLQDTIILKHAVAKCSKVEKCDINSSFLLWCFLPQSYMAWTCNLYMWYTSLWRQITAPTQATYKLQIDANRRYFYPVLDIVTGEKRTRSFYHNHYHNLHNDKGKLQLSFC